MKSTFRITYKPRFKNQAQCTSEYIARTVEAYTSSEAIKAIGDYWTIRSVTVQCAGTTKAGEPCQRFSHNDYCCDAHKPQPKPKLHTGAASILVSINGPSMWVKHGTSGELLATTDEAPEAAWKDLWAALDRIGLNRVAV